jgi:hypothetical protein
VSGQINLCVMELCNYIVLIFSSILSFSDVIARAQPSFSEHTCIIYECVLCLIYDLFVKKNKL